jgi:O-antigen ligase
MARTLVLERGSFEAFSSLVRFYAWQAAWHVFLDHPIFGVGFLGFRLISVHYNTLGLSLFTAESIFLEAATGMGVIGLTALVYVIVRLYQLGRAVSKVAPPGTMGAGMAQFHAPLITGFVVGNLTGDNWVGLVGLAQTALWCAMLVSAGERSISDRHPA